MSSRLTSDDQQRVDEYLNLPQHRIERKPFRPWLLLLLVIGMVLGLGLLSRLLAGLAQ